MGRTEHEAEPICHVTQFIVSDDKDQSTSLTVRVRSTWFHIFTTYDLLSTKTNDHGVANEYAKLRDNFFGKPSSSEINSKDPSPEESQGDGTEAEAQAESSTAEQELQNWLLASFGPVFSEKAPDQQDEQTLFDWYEAPLFVYYLITGKKGELQPVLEDDDEKVHAVRLSLCPRCLLPKTDSNLNGIDWFSPKDLVVLDESAEPEPYHPSRVKYIPPEKEAGKKQEEQEFFLKMHIPHQDHSTKREIRHLHEIQKFGLEDKGVCVPQLKGYVSHVRNPSSRAQILGFLIDPIASPVPLTYMMDSSIEAHKREKWAKESQDMVSTLHDAGIVWGDAKGDNFVVDKDEKLWMIDFGGGYTEGWVDQKLMETLDGDEMGTKLLVDGLRDPDGQGSSGATTPQSQDDDHLREARTKNTSNNTRQGEKRKERSSRDHLVEKKMQKMRRDRAKIN